MEPERTMLGNWEEIVQSLRRYPIRSEGSDIVTFDFPEQGPLQEIFQVKCAEVLGRTRIFIGINVDNDGAAQAHEALVINSETAIGSLCAFKGMLVLKHVMTVGGFDRAELYEVIGAMARTAELARGRLTKPVARPSATYID